MIKPRRKPKIVYLPQLDKDGIYRMGPFTVEPHPFDPDYVIKEPLMKTKKRNVQRVKRNAQDATLRNIRALKKRMAKIERLVKMLNKCWRIYG